MKSLYPSAQKPSMAATAYTIKFKLFILTSEALRDLAPAFLQRLTRSSPQWGPHPKQEELIAHGPCTHLALSCPCATAVIPQVTCPCSSLPKPPRPAPVSPPLRCLRSPTSRATAWVVLRPHGLDSAQARGISRPGDLVKHAGLGAPCPERSETVGLLGARDLHCRRASGGG